MIQRKDRIQEQQGKRIKNNYYYNHHFSVIIKEKW
mgnify:CR=1 FL=1